MRENWEKVFTEVIKSEGGYVNHPDDPGGPTNLGITQATLSRYLGRAATVADVRALTKETVKPIYRRNFWDVIRGDELPSGVDYATYDFAVNSGPTRAARYLQSVVGVVQDGRIGPETIAAVNRYSAEDVVKKLVAKRRGYLMGLRAWRTFGKGWNNRLVSVQTLALKLSPPSTGVDYAGLSSENAPDHPVADDVEVSAQERSLNQKTGDDMALAQLEADRESGMLSGTKRYLASKTVWAGILGFLSVMPIVGGYLAGENLDQASDAIAATISGASSLFAIYGRIMARYQLSAK